jgi:hypothetical protein
MKKPFTRVFSFLLLQVLHFYLFKQFLYYSQLLLPTPMVFNMMTKRLPGSVLHAKHVGKYAKFPHSSFRFQRPILAAQFSSESKSKSLLMTAKQSWKNTKTTWYPIPISMGIAYFKTGLGCLAFLQFLKIQKREKELAAQHDHLHTKVEGPLAVFEYLFSCVYMHHYL